MCLKRKKKIQSLENLPTNNHLFKYQDQLQHYYIDNILSQIIQIVQIDF